MAANGYLATDILTTGNEQTITADRKGSIVSFDQTAMDMQLGAESATQISVNDALGPAPTDEEYATLRKVPGKMPIAAYLLCAVEFAERASYYGVAQIFGNFIQFPLPEGGNGAGAPPVGSQKTAGALGLGLQGSSGISQTFKFLAYTMPILGAWIADAKWGRFKTICYGVGLCGISHVIMAAGAIPSVLQAGHGTAPFIISMIMLAVGAGLFKSNVSVLLIDQNPHKRPYVSTLKSGEKVIVDPETTVSRILLWFYMQVNVGAFFALATTYAEKRVGWWLAFLLPAIIYFLLPILLLFVYKRTIKIKPTGNDLAKVFKVIGVATKTNGIKGWGRKGFLDAAKPSISGVTYNWNDRFVDDVKRTFTACQIFIFFPLFYMNDSGIGNVQGSQAGTMTTNGAPNDLLNNFNPLTIIVFIPILNFVIYPLLRRWNVRFGRIGRITFGFALVAVNGLIGTIIQYKIYTTSPCGYRATECAEADGTVSPITVWAQVPVYVLGAAAECFAQVTAYEVAYSQAPMNMKSLVTAIFLFMNALSSAIGAAVTPATKDPYLIWIFAGPTIGGFILTPLFYFLYRHLDKEDERKLNLYDLPTEGQDHPTRETAVETGSLEKTAQPEGIRHGDEKVSRADLAPGAHGVETEVK